MELSRIWISILTKGDEDAGTNEGITLKISTQNTTRIDRYIPYSNDTNRTGPGFEDQPYLDRKEANLYHIPVRGTNIVPEDLFSDDAEVLLGIKGDNAWAPQHIFLWGETAHTRQVFPLVIETDIEPWLSTDSSEGPEFLQLRTIQKGDAAMTINRLLLVTLTEGTSRDDSIWTDPNPYFGTDDPVHIEISRQGETVVSYEIADSPQTDFDSGFANMYFFPAKAPFSKAELDSESIVLTLGGQDEWVPRKLFLFGLNTAEGRANAIVPLVYLDYWPFGAMRTEGEAESVSKN